MFTFFIHVPCPSRLTTTQTLARYFITTSRNYASQAAILNTVFTRESDRTFCQKLNEIERALDNNIPLTAFTITITVRIKVVYLHYILDLCILAYKQDKSPQCFHSNRPDSSGDTPKSSSPRSSLVSDNLINLRKKYDKRNQKHVLRFTLYISDDDTFVNFY